MKKQRVAIFASGQGSNAANIMTYFKDHPGVQIVAILTNNPSAGVISHAGNFGVPVHIVSNEEAGKSEFLIDLCTREAVDYIVLAGYLRMIPEAFAKAFDKKIINIHPSLLPKFGGKGMYGDHVHRAVIASGENESGITVHFVNSAYDEGEVIGQASCKLENNETLETLKEKISLLEKTHFPVFIEQIISDQNA